MADPVDMAPAMLAGEVERDGDIAIGRRIRELREAKGWTLRRLAREMDLSAPFISDVEHGRRSIEHRIHQVVALLGGSADELYALKGTLPPDLRRWIAEHPSIVRLIRRHRAAWDRDLRLGAGKGGAHG